MKAIVIALTSVLTLYTGMAWPERGPRSSIERYLYPPELVMRHYEEIGLTDEQQANIRAAMKKTQGDLFDLQWDVEKASGALAKLVKQKTVNEQEALARMDALLQIETKIKMKHLTLLVQIKNLLTAEQQEKLNKLKPHRRFDEGPRSRRGNKRAFGSQRPDGLRPR